MTALTTAEKDTLADARNEAQRLLDLPPWRSTPAKIKALEAFISGPLADIEAKMADDWAPASLDEMTLWTNARMAGFSDDAKADVIATLQNLAPLRCELPGLSRRMIMKPYEPQEIMEAYRIAKADDGQWAGLVGSIKTLLAKVSTRRAEFDRPDSPLRLHAVHAVAVGCATSEDCPADLVALGKALRKDWDDRIAAVHAERNRLADWVFKGKAPESVSVEDALKALKV